VSSSSRGSSSSVRVEFAAGTDMDLAVMDVRDRVDQVRGLLPDGVERIRIRRFQSDDRPILDADLAWTGDGERLFDIVRKIVEPRLLRVDGVANVTIDGIEEKQLTVALDQQRLSAHDVSIQLLANQLRGNNVNVSVGRVMDGDLRYQVRAKGEFESVEQIGAQPVPRREITLADLGEVRYEYPERTRIERLNGSEAVEVELYKASTANVIDVAQQARAVLADIDAQFGDELDIVITRDRAHEVLRELNNLRDTALLGGILAIGIIFIFLRSVRSTIVIGVAIPVSVCCVFTGIYIAREVFGSPITLNMVSMLGLMLAVGMLVDPAVVTLESIFRRRQEEGAGPVEAAIEGSREIGLAVIASALTTMCVFIPFFFVNTGRMSRFMGDAGVTICLAIGVSAIVSLAVIPLASSRLFRDGWERYDPLLKFVVVVGVLAMAAWKFSTVGMEGFIAWGQTTGHRVVTQTLSMGATTAAILVGIGLLLAGLAWYFRRHGMRSSYVRLVNWTLDHRAVTLGVTIGFFGLGIWLMTQLEQQGMAWTPERRVDLSIEVERSYSLAETDSLFHRVELQLLARKNELDIESVSSRFSQRGGSISARLVDADEGNLSTMEASSAIRQILPEKVGVTYKMGRSRSWSGPQLGVEIQLKGIDMAVLEILAEDVQLRLSRIPGVIDVDTSLEDGEEEIQVSVDREQALGYGLSARDVASTIATALGTRRTTDFKAPEREIGVVMQLEEADRVSVEQIKNTTFEGRDDSRVQLGALADFQFAKGPRTLQREDRQQTLTVFANTEDRRAAMRLTPVVTQMMSDLSLPPGYSWQTGRATRWMQQDTQDNTFVLVFALLLIYLIMASLFESLIHPFTIMFAIPFSLIGVAIGFFALDQPLDMNGILGLLILFGIVVNNGIVLVDHINQYRREGLDRRSAILRGGQNRMRPILMT
ncbi:MAG: efflux RND transporter permease subunit, partial [Gemmatimonadetes bacterium]|nr:efflux RND transporter permease subunit [Gemmatimonadota bacterium]